MSDSLNCETELELKLLGAVKYSLELGFDKQNKINIIVILKYTCYCLLHFIITLLEL